MAQKKSKVTSPPRPKRKPKIGTTSQGTGIPMKMPSKKQPVIISGPNKKDSQQHKIDALSDAGWGDATIMELIRTGNIGPAYKNLGENKEMDRFRMKPKKRKGGGKVLYKRHGGMSHVGLSPAEEARAGTMSEAERARYMQGGGPIHTTFSKRAAPRTEGREPEVDLFPKVERKKGKKVGKKKQGYKARKDESIAMRVKKKRTKKQLKASRRESYGKWGKGKGKGKINRVSHKQTDGNKVVASIYD
jgi:hypothetical protein